MIECRALLRGVGVLYRSAQYPLSEDGAAIWARQTTARCSKMRS
jgi:hypothetical protein